MEVNIQPIMNELKLVRKELHQIKQSMPDKEMFLTAEESVLLEESYGDEKEGKLISGKDLRKELGI